MPLDTRGTFQGHVDRIFEETIQKHVQHVQEADQMYSLQSDNTSIKVSYGELPRQLKWRLLNCLWTSSMLVFLL